jgi:hypothetical protein
MWIFFWPKNSLQTPASQRSLKRSQSLRPKMRALPISGFQKATHLANLISSLSISLKTVIDSLCSLRTRSMQNYRSIKLKGIANARRNEQASGDYSDFEIILCAPEHYIGNRHDLDGFDRKLSLEQIAEIIEQPQDKRASYRAHFLRTAGTKRINAWTREDDPATNKFWDAAYELAAHEFPILEMKRLKLTKGSQWITLRPRDFPTMPKYVYVSLKGDRGYVDLTFGRTTAHQFHSAIHHLLEPRMIVQQTGASVAIRIETSPFQISEGFANALPKVKAAFGASSRLIAFYRRFQKELNEGAAAATPF